MSKLFIINSTLKTIKESLDSVKRMSSLNLSFNLNHNFHDVAVILKKTLMLFKEIGGESICKNKHA